MSFISRYTSSILGVLLLSSLSYWSLQTFLWADIQTILSIDPTTAGVKVIFGLLWTPVICYVLIGCLLCQSINLFKPLKSFKERGLLFWLTAAFLANLLHAALSALPRGIEYGFTIGLGQSLLYVALGACVAFPAGMLIGLSKEFKTTS